MVWIRSLFNRYDQSYDPYSGMQLFRPIMCEVASLFPVAAVVAMGFAAGVSWEELWRFTQFSACTTGIVYCFTSCVKVYQRRTYVELELQRKQARKDGYGAIQGGKQQSIDEEKRRRHAIEEEKTTLSGYMVVTSISLIAFLYVVGIYIRIMKQEIPGEWYLRGATGATAFVVVTSLFKMVGSIGYSEPVALALKDPPVRELRKEM